MQSSMDKRINVGCGQRPTPGWDNYDNSWSIKLAERPLARTVLEGLGFLSEPQREFIEFAREHTIQWACGSRRLPDEDGAVAVVYSSHMIEHLDRDEARAFLGEARRVLRPGGVLRLAVPNIRWHVDNYLRDGDADHFVAATHLTRPKPKSLAERLRYLVVGERDHQWMYDGTSICAVLEELGGFEDVRVMEPGTTRIQDPGHLDLHERCPESVFVEATRV